MTLPESKHENRGLVTLHECPKRKGKFSPTINRPWRATHRQLKHYLIWSPLWKHPHFKALCVFGTFTCVVWGFMYYFSQSFRQKCITYFVIFGCCQAGSGPNAWMPLNNLWTQRCVALLTLWLGSCEIRYLSNINLSPCPRPATCHYSAFTAITLYLSRLLSIDLMWMYEKCNTDRDILIKTKHSKCL